jgi:hypothetical protein
LFTVSVNAAPMNNDATEVDINAIPGQYIVVFKDDVKSTLLRNMNLGQQRGTPERKIQARIRCIGLRS